MKLANIWTLFFVGDDLAAARVAAYVTCRVSEMIKPYQKRYFEFIKSRTKAKLMYHSCGSVVPLIPDLIEIEVDILNPIQVNAADMDPRQLKKEFGDQLCFCGAIDTKSGYAERYH